MTVSMTSDRHATWLELFFDLVVVVAVSQLTHLLEDPSALHLAAFFTLYAAIWLMWTSYTIYANVASERTRTGSMLIGMAGIAVMAAAIPEATGEHATVFAVAYIVTNSIASRTVLGTGKVVVSWSAVQRNIGLLPWIVSFWVDEQPVKLLLWTLGVLMTIAGAVLERTDADDIARMNERFRREVERRRRRGAPGADRPAPLLEAADLHGSHLGERLGLFVIIVLGEAVLQLVRAASQASWDWTLLLTGVAGFGLLAGLWWLNFRYGFGEDRDTPPRYLLPAHLIAVVSITTVAYGLGVVAHHATASLPVSQRWLLCAGLAACFALSAVANRAWYGLGFAAVPLLLAALGWAIPAVIVVIVLALVVGVHAGSFARWVRSSP